MVYFPTIFLVVRPAKGNLPAAGAEIAAHYYRATPQSQRCATQITAWAE
jgi:hypothetical protein